jgi:hypothetical protein
MKARRMVGTTALGAAMATGGCYSTEVPNVAALAQRSERIEFPYHAARSIWLFRRADGVFDLGDYRVFVHWLDERDKELFDQYDVFVEERGRKLVGLRCGTFSEATLSNPSSSVYILRCRDGERGSQLFIEEGFAGVLGKRALYRGPRFYMQVAEGCFAGVGTARDCQSPSNPLIVEARRCPDDLQLNLGAVKKPAVQGRLEAAAVIEGDKASLFVPQSPPARDFVVSSMVLLLSFARLDRLLPRGTLIGIPGCE